MGKPDIDINKLRHSVVDKILIAGAILVLPAMISIFFRDISYNLNIHFFIQLALVLSVEALAIFRKKIPIGIKMYFIIVGLMLLIVSGLYHRGFIASAKVYIIMASVLISFLMSYRKALIWLTFFMVIYALMGYLHISGYKVSVFEFSTEAIGIRTWATDGIILFLSSFCLLYVGNSYSRVLMEKLEIIKKQNHILSESEEQYRKLVISFPDIIMLSDLKGNIIYGNSNLKKITGITEKDYNNPDRAAHVHPEDRYIVEKAMKDLLNGIHEKTDVIENRFIDTSGNIHWFSGTMTKLYMNDKMVIQTVSRDITEAKQIEFELENYRNNLEKLVKKRTDEYLSANEELESTLENLKTAQSHLFQSEKMASLGILTAGVAHEINNPLNYMMGAYTGLERHYRSVAEENEEVEILLDALKTGIDKVTNIVKGLNQFSRTNDSYEELCDIHSIIDNCIEILRGATKRKAIIKKEYAPVTITTKGNVGKLHQVFTNIITNACHAIADEGEIIVSTRVTEKYAYIQIIDNGEGISKENMMKIADPFFTTKEPGVGTGLGLSITYNIIHEHKGEIEYKSEPGVGTEVSITLPL